MSSIEIYKIDKDGHSFFAQDIKNSWRGAILVWMEMEKKYLPQYIPLILSREIQDMFSDKSKKHSWLKKKYVDYSDFRKNIDSDDLAVLGLENYNRCVGFDISNMKEIWNLCDDKSVDINDRICLWTTFDFSVLKREDIPIVVNAMKHFCCKGIFDKQIKVLENLYKDTDCFAVAWNQTSVNTAYWTPCYNDCEEDEVPFNLFDEMAKNEDIELFDISIFS